MTPRRLQEKYKKYGTAKEAKEISDDLNISPHAKNKRHILTSLLLYLCGSLHLSCMSETDVIHSSKIPQSGQNTRPPQKSTCTNLEPEL